MPRHGLVGVSPKLHPLLNRAPPSTELEAACSAASPVMSPKGGVEREKEREKGEECDCVRGSEVKCHETCPWMELHSVYLSQLRPIGAQVFTAFAIRTRTVHVIGKIHLPRTSRQTKEQSTLSTTSKTWMDRWFFNLAILFHFHCLSWDCGSVDFPLIHYVWISECRCPKPDPGPEAECLVYLENILLTSAK